MCVISLRFFRMKRIKQPLIKFWMLFDNKLLVKTKKRTEKTVFLCVFSSAARDRGRIAFERTSTLEQEQEQEQVYQKNDLLFKNHFFFRNKSKKKNKKLKLKSFKIWPTLETTKNPFHGTLKLLVKKKSMLRTTPNFFCCRSLGCC